MRVSEDELFVILTTFDPADVFLRIRQCGSSHIALECLIPHGGLAGLLAWIRRQRRGITRSLVVGKAKSKVVKMRDRGGINRGVGITS